jgi:hypothetical protein
MWGPGRNVYLTIEDMLQGIYTEVPPAFLDLLDVATYVYAADQAVARTGGDDSQPNWRRNFLFRVPVRAPDLWRSAGVLDTLVETLSFLSEDEYRFEFRQLDEGHSFRDYVIDFKATAFDGVVEEVVMFSGGLDSLGGAVREAVTGRRKVLLVNHRSNPKPGPRQQQLVESLVAHARDVAPLYLPVRINKSSQLSCEYTQRSRSFLYAALGATVARMIGLPRFRFYENGVMSLNLPLAPQEIGARATRTTHPRVVDGFSRLFGALAGQPLAVENPFLFETKTDVVTLIAEAGCADLIALTKSCVETRGRSSQAPHCGVCSQCIDRRFAVLAAGQVAHDPAGGYVVDLVTGARPDSESRTLLAAYLDTATRIEGMSERQFLAHFGEVSRALRYMPGGSNEALRQAYSLLRRHARQVNGVVDRLVAAAAATGEFRRGELPETCLVRLVSDSGPTALSEVAPHGGAENVFRWRGQAWAVRYRGGEENIALPHRGVAYLHALICRPNVPISAVQLLCDVMKRGKAAEFRLGDVGSGSDADALAAYREKANELRADIEKANARGDTVSQRAAEAELEWFLGELQRNAEFRGRAKRFQSDREKVRKSVTNAIGRAITAIEKFDAPLGQHLDQAITRGNDCVYAPEAGLIWVT